MRNVSATVADVQQPAAHLRLLTLAAPDMPTLRPGQLTLVRVNESFDPYLRRAYFPLTYPQAPGLTLIVSDTDLLARKQTGDRLDLIAPVGNGFALDAGARRLLLIGDAAHLAPLMALAHEATAKQIAVSLLVEAASAEREDSRRALERLLPIDVEYQVTPSADEQIAGLLRWCDQLCAAGAAEMYTRIRNALAQSAAPIRENFAQAVIAPPMACGFGACLGCAVETARGMRLACVEGPVFDLMLCR